MTSCEGDFKTVSRKRKSKSNMEVDDSSQPAVKRPNFPQISADKLLVSYYCIYLYILVNY